MRFEQFKSFDLLVAVLVGLLVITSVAMIYSLTVERTGNSLALNQGIFALVGLAVSGSLAVLYYRRLRTFVLPSFGVGMILLGLVLILGKTVFGAQRWIDLGNFQFQPSEPMKLFLILFLAHALSLREAHQLHRTGFITFTVLLVIAFTLVALQPDLGTAAVFGLVTLSLLLTAKLPRAFWLSLLGVAVIALPMAWLNLKDYQVARIETFLRPTADPLGAGYNIIQSLIAVGNGGLFGQGFGQGTQSQLDFLPVVHTDFIFAGIAESVGFVGSAILLSVFAVLILRSLNIARRAPDRFGSSIALGIASLWFIQVVVNVGMNLGLAPVTGIPLPFISAGGTALVTNLAALGIVESIALRGEALRRA